MDYCDTQENTSRSCMVCFSLRKLEEFMDFIVMDVLILRDEATLKKWCLNATKK